MTVSNPALPLTPAATEFIESVLPLRPRIAAFDCDGTLWAGDSGAQFLYWELDRGLLPEPVVRWIGPRYDDYLAGRVSEEVICGEMVTIHAGLSVDELNRAAEEYFAEKFESAIFPEMLELVHRLREQGCEIWAVSSTNEWVVRAGVKHFGIPDEKILSACVQSENGVATARLVRVPTDEDKAVAIRECIKRDVDAVFGNSVHDAAMLDLAKHAFAINPNPDLQKMAADKGWKVYFPG